MSETHSEEQPVQASGSSGAGAGARALGIERWVQFAFIATAAVLFWLLDKLIAAVWDIFQEPNPTIVTASAATVAIVLAYGLYRNERISSMVNEVVVELAQVTWPTRVETRTATVVVIVTSLIAAVILGVFDAAWSAVTDLIYTTGG